MQAPDLMRGFLATALVAAFMVALSWLTRFAIPPENEQLVTFMLGQLSGFTGAAVAYYLGTSKSSADKEKRFMPPPAPPAKGGDFEPDPLDQPRTGATP